MNNGGMLQKWIVAILSLSIASACSMKDRSQAYGISVKLPVQAQQSLLQANLFNQALTSFSTPVGMTGLQCFALNITGPGVKADSRFTCKRSGQTFGVTGGMAPIAGGTVDAMVPAGPSRLIQLIGFQSTIGCPSFDSILNSLNPNDPGKGGVDGLGDPYLLGSATTDVFSDVTVNIHANFDPNQKLFDNCDDGNGDGGAKTLTFQTINQSQYVQGTDVCTPLSVEAHNVSAAEVGSLPTIMPTVTKNSTAGTVTLYSNATCTTALTAGAYMNFPTGQQNLPLYVKASSSTGSFSVQVQTTATGWSTPELTYQLASEHLVMSISTPSNLVTPSGAASGCGSMAFYHASTGSNSALPTAESYDFYLYNNSGNTTPAAEFYYSVADCMAGTPKITSVGSDPKSIRYLLQFSGGSSNLYFRDPVPEILSPSISSKAGATTPMQPAIGSLSFLPFQLSSNPNSFPVALDGGASVGTPAQITISFLNASGAFVSAVKVNGVVAQSFFASGGSVSFMAPRAPGSAPGSYPIVFLGPDGLEYPTGLNVQYLPFATGNGTSGNPYTIETPAQFLALGNFPGLYFKQTQNLNFAAATASGSNFLLSSFSGQYDGNHLSIAHTPRGLFAFCSLGSTIQNLSVDIQFNQTVGQTNLGGICGESHANLSGITLGGYINANSAGNVSVGGLVGSNFEGLISDSSSTLILTATTVNASVGGLVGLQNDGTGQVVSSNVTAGVTGGDYGAVGGVVGNVVGTGSVTSSWSSGDVFGGIHSTVGGVAGIVNGATLNKTFATGTVTGSGLSTVGGLVGSASSSAHILFSFAKGGVIGGDFAGGLIGALSSGTISDSFSIGNVTADITSGTAGGFTSVIQGSSSITNCYAVTASIAGSATGLFATSINGTIATSYAYSSSSPTVSNIGGLVTLSSLAMLDNLTSGYPGLSASNWSSQTATVSAGDLGKTPALSWACALPAGFTCQ